MSTHTKLIKIVFFVTLAVILLTEAVRWGSNYKEEARLSSATFEYPGIKDFNIEFTDNNIVLKVYLEKPSTCEIVMDFLDIKQIEVKGRIYKPLCVVTNPKLITLTYRESRML